MASRRVQDVSRGGWRRVAALAALAMPTVAGAQSAGLRVEGTPPACAGESTIAGVTYTCDEVMAWVEVHRADPARLPADLPPQVRMVVYALAAPPVVLPTPEPTR